MFSSLLARVPGLPLRPVDALRENDGDQGGCDDEGAAEVGHGVHLLVQNQRGERRGPRDRDDRGDRKPYGDKPRFDKNREDRPREDRPRDDKPRFDKPRGENSWGDKPRSDKPRGDKSWGDKPKFDKPKRTGEGGKATVKARGASDRGDKPAGFGAAKPAGKPKTDWSNPSKSGRKGPPPPKGKPNSKKNKARAAAAGKAGGNARPMRKG